MKIFQLPTIHDIAIAVFASLVVWGLVAGSAQALLGSYYPNAGGMDYVSAVPYRQVSASSTPNQTASSTTAKLDPACMAETLTKRDNAIISSLDVYNEKIKTALRERTASSTAAWQTSDRLQRKAAIRRIWEKFKFDVRLATRELSERKKTAWLEFNTARKSCGIYATYDDSATRYVDANL